MREKNFKQKTNNLICLRKYYTATNLWAAKKVIMYVEYTRQMTSLNLKILAKQSSGQTSKHKIKFSALIINDKRKSIISA